MSFRKRKGITIGLALIAVTFMMFMAILMPVLAIKIHVDREIMYETNYNNAQLTLLSLLSSTETDSLDNKVKSVSEIIAEWIAFDNKPSIGFLKQKLDLLMENKPYKLYYLVNSNEVLIAQGSTSFATQYTYPYKAEAKLALPYNQDKMVWDVVLVIE